MKLHAAFKLSFMLEVLEKHGLVDADTAGKVCMGWGVGQIADWGLLEGTRMSRGTWAWCLGAAAAAARSRSSGLSCVGRAWQHDG